MRTLQGSNRVRVGLLGLVVEALTASGKADKATPFRAEAAARNANGDKNIPTSPFHDYVQRANPAVRARL